MEPRRIRVRTTLIALLGVLAVMLVAVPAVSATGSVASAKARLRAVETRLDDVSTRSEIAVEKYNQASTQLQTVQAKIDENQRQLEVARQNLAQASEQLVLRAQSIYKARDVGVIDVIFQADSFDDLISQMDMMERLGNSDVDTIHAIAAFKRDIKDRRVRLEADEKAAARLVAERERHKDELLLLEADLRDLTGKIERQIKKLRAEARRRARVALTGFSGPIPVVDPNSPGHPEIVAIAQRYFGVPYVWGGASPGGFDCSGLTMYCYASIGIGLYHGATMQQRASSPVALTDLRPGDLIFFGNASFSHHVAIFVGGTTCIEAPRTGDVVRYGTWTGRDAWIGGRF